MAQAKYEKDMNVSKRFAVSKILLWLLIFYCTDDKTVDSQYQGDDSLVTTFFFAVAK